MKDEFEYDELQYNALKVIFILLMTILICGKLCSCTPEKEVQATISTGKVVKVEQMTNRCVVKVQDFNDSVLYSDYFVPLSYFRSFIIGQPIWIIVKR